MITNEYELTISAFKNCIEITKNSNRLYYKVLKSNEDLTIFYDNTKTTIYIQISSANVNIDEISSYSKEDLQSFNFLDANTVDSNRNFQLLVFKVILVNNRFYGKNKVA
ncbi:hypothetical protein CPU12_01920 [Malaciobacter molluscorum LMG 25693]|uniref:Uncharacterized protein n=1 Tax=Malaciobacter molluscorum LMG 25693 TaxID=870501 RepID=A0A2G1DKK6_9BACT|nr:hypothetical protein [Malaciobacter molluscorum]AXX92603.1 hypothetical protein AMOL_1637 [Malaciobacter molluscorum LMG 25693]PHO19028.1 hypothetical protein CPU12_01920 [Malaciobacter molluscorum LMG 25693]